MYDKNLKASVFNIQTYCIHDGPGIRTTVFLKGCPLRCIWCANPESNEFYPQLMTYSSKCTGCGRCIPECPKKAISLSQFEDKVIAVTDRDLCVNCGKCAEVCPAEAREIAGTERTVEDVISEVVKDKLFMDASGGGMTISGGEALSRPDFTAALFEAAHEQGLHTCIETSSFASRQVIDKVFAHVDLGLLDVKHMDSDKHKKYTGVPNEQILDNIAHIHNDLGVEVVIRVPVIPECNGDRKNIAATAKWIRDTLGTDVRINLLPYHQLGESKSESLGNMLHEVYTVPSNDYMEELLEICRSYGIDGQIGG